MRWTLIEDSEQKHEIKIGLQTIMVTTKVYWTYDDHLDVGDMDDEYAKKFDNGELDNLLIKVSAYWEGFEGTDILGQCHVSCIQDSFDLVNAYNMRQVAIDELKQEIKDKIELLKGF